MIATVYVLVTWDEHMPTVRSMEDEHEAIEALKDEKTTSHRATLYACDETGQAVEVTGW